MQLAEDFRGSNMMHIQREPVVLVLDANSQVKKQTSHYGIIHDI